MKASLSRVLGVSLALCVCPRAALAKDPSKAEVQLAKDMVKEAIVEGKAGRCEDAIQILKQAVAIHETAEALSILGDCEATQGLLRAAVATWKRGEEVAEEQKDKTRREAIEKKRKEFEPKIPTLRLKLPADVTGASVTIDGEAVPEARLGEPVLVDPGVHVVEAKAPGRKPFSSKVEAEDEARLTVEVALPLDGSKPPGPAEGKSGGLPIGVWIAGGAAVLLVGVGVGAYIGAGAQAQAGEDACRARAQCDAGRIDTVRTLDGLALGAWIGAGLAAGGAVGIWALSPKKATKDEVSARIVVGPGSVSIVGRF